MTRFSITLAAAVILAAPGASAYADTWKLPLECASTKNANECADILQKLGKNPFDAFEPVLDDNGKPVVVVKESDLNLAYFGAASRPIVYTDKNGRRLSLSPVDKDGFLQTPFTFLIDPSRDDPDDRAPRATCSGLPEGAKSQRSNDPPGVECHMQLFGHLDLTPLSPEEIAADHRKALLECDRQPTWLGVLFCRWDSR